MELPFDILDSIFCFLRSHPNSLIACSKAHHVFSRLVERHLYYHIRFPTARDLRTTTGITGYTLEPSYLIELLKRTPHIVQYIRVLQIDFSNIGLLDIAKIQRLYKITLALPVFSMLECLVLRAPCYVVSWERLPEDFRTAVDNCLHLSTLRRLLVGKLDFPLSILNKRVDINCLSLSRTPKTEDLSTDTNPQLTALSFGGINHNVHLKSFIAWAKPHIVNLQSLKCDYSNNKPLSELLKTCSDTLNSLDLHLTARYETKYDSFQATYGSTPSINLSSLPHLQRLTIRGMVYNERSMDNSLDGYSHLPAIVEIFESAPLLRHLTIDILVQDGQAAWSQYHFYSKVEFPFFTALAEAAPSFRHIDLYIRGISDSWFVYLFGNYGGVTALIERGVLVIHRHETAPGDYRFVG